MFAYCLNNPVMSLDPTGKIAISTLILIGSAVVGAACGGYTAYTTYQAGWDTADILWYTFGATLGGFLTAYSLGTSLYQVYLQYCMLNGMTPITNIGPSTSTQIQDNPLDDIAYTEKVQQQMQQDDYHGFPNIVDNYGGYGYQQSFTGGDGNIYTKLIIPGTYRGHEGAFVYIWNENGMCNHRMFEVS